MKSKHEELTQKYSTWGDKLLQHTDVLYSIQKLGEFKPITIQLAPCEKCDSDCPFCSVAARPIKSFIPFPKICKMFEDFASLGAKSVEISGGGNPLLYYDRESKATINDIVKAANKFGFDVGIITNSHKLEMLKPEVHDMINWVRVSLIQLDEGREPEDYDFNGFPYDKLGFSYIIYETDGVPDELSRTNRVYKGTTAETIRKIANLVELHPGIKFVRIAGNCLIKGNNARVSDKFKPIVDEVDKFGKFFVKDIYDNDSPFNDGCYVGAVRPYIAPNPHGGDYQVYICTSHVLQKRVYDLDYSLCSIDDIVPTWKAMSERYKKTGSPYEVKGNGGKDWCKDCKFCYYYNNNKLLHTVANEMPDRNFP